MEIPNSLSGFIAHGYFASRAQEEIDKLYDNLIIAGPYWFRQAAKRYGDKGHKSRLVEQIDFNFSSSLESIAKSVHTFAMAYPRHVFDITKESVEFPPAIPSTITRGRRRKFVAFMPEEEAPVLNLPLRAVILEIGYGYDSTTRQREVALVFSTDEETSWLPGDSLIHTRITPLSIEPISCYARAGRDIRRSLYRLLIFGARTTHSSLHSREIEQCFRVIVPDVPRRLLKLAGQ